MYMVDEMVVLLTLCLPAEYSLECGGNHTICG